MTETAQTFSGRADDFAAILDRADPQWDAPTPCDGWTVRDVVVHVIDTERDFLERHDLGAGPTPDLDDPAGAWRTHAAHVADVLGRTGVTEGVCSGAVPVPDDASATDRLLARLGRDPEWRGVRSPAE